MSNQGQTRQAIHVQNALLFQLRQVDLLRLVSDVKGQALDAALEEELDALVRVLCGHEGVVCGASEQVSEWRKE